jgi:uncharacterized UPF0160 family protein
MLPVKRPLQIATHSGTFHCDEVVAVSMLKMLVNNNYNLTRSRDQTKLDASDIVVDVGGVFDPATCRFDHHQRGFEEYFTDAYTTKSKLSSAGLIYKYFGRQLLKETFNCPERFVDRVYAKIYDNFILSIDAIDNGVNIADEPRYSIKTDLASRVSRLNPSWLEDGVVDENERFLQAVEIATEEINAQVKGLVELWLPARRIVEDAIDARFDFHPSGRIISLPQFCPWIEHLFDIEEESASGLGKRKLEAEIIYCIFGDQTGQYRVRAVPKHRGSFENRLSLPENLRGLRDDEVSEIAGIPYLIFVHHSGFIAGAKTAEAAKKLAELGIAQLD